MRRCVYTYQSLIETIEYCFDEKELGDIMKDIRRSMKKSAVFSLIILINIFLLSSVQAAWVPLTSTMPISSIPAGGLVVDDKLFSDFLVDGLAQGGALKPTASTVFVQGGKESVTGDYGLKFFLDWDAGSNQSINVNIDYKVSILPGYASYFIDGAWTLLSLAGATGSGVVAATETLWDAPLPFGDWLATLSTSWQVGGSGLDLKDYANFAQVKQMWVNNGFTVTGGLSGTAKLNEVFQMYTQIPEPATLILLGLGSLALLRKRRQ